MTRPEVEIENPAPESPTRRTMRRRGVRIRRDKLILERTRAGWTQQRLAEEAGVDNETVYRIENGKSLGSAEVIGKLAACLNVDIEVLAEVTSITEPEVHPLEAAGELDTRVEMARRGIDYDAEPEEEPEQPARGLGTGRCGACGKVTFSHRSLCVKCAPGAVEVADAYAGTLDDEDADG